jgi:hypothetical protein
MISTRTVGLGLMLVLAIGVATWSPAQQAGEKAGSAAPKGGELHERVLRLRSEVDLLQLEFDAARANLLEAFKKLGERDLGDPTAKEFAEFRSGLEQMVWNARLAGLGDEQVDKIIKGLKDSRKASEEELKVVKDFFKGGEGSEAALDRMVQMEVPARAKFLRAAIDRLKPEFARKSRVLNEKKLDLAEAERQYQREAR